MSIIITAGVQGPEGPPGATGAGPTGPTGPPGATGAGATGATGAGKGHRSQRRLALQVSSSFGTSRDVPPAHTTQKGWEPDKVPALWKKVA